MPGRNSKPYRTVRGTTVHFSISPQSECPCGSCLPASTCCLTPKGFTKAPAATSPPNPRTAAQHSKCYANLLNDCSVKISREHFVSQNVLEVLDRQGGLRVDGLPWQKAAGPTSISPNAFTSKVLCERHNRALSPLDSIASRLFQSLDEHCAAGSGQQLLYLFSGHDIERWLLKVLCGLAASRSIPPHVTASTTVPKPWLDTLFGVTDFSAGQGLYVCCVPGEVFAGPRGLVLAPLASQEELVGIGASVCGYDLILVMEPIADRTLNGRKFAYRPMELHTTGRSFEKSVMFSWRGPADLGTISLAIRET